MIGCLRTRVHMQPIIALYFEFETVLKCYNLEPRSDHVGYNEGIDLLIWPFESRSTSHVVKICHTAFNVNPAYIL